MPSWNYKTSLTGKLFEDFICVFGITLVISVQILMLIQHFVVPETTCFLYSLVPEGYKNGWTFFLSTVLDQIHAIIFTCNMCALGLVVLCYLCNAE